MQWLILPVSSLASLLFVTFQLTHERILYETSEIHISRMQDKMTRRTRDDPEWQMLISEYQALKRKLHSKSEAVLILSKDLGSAHKERDYLKQMIEKLKNRCQGYRRQLSEYKVSGDQAALLQMLRDAKNQKLAHQKQNEILQQKLNEALGDIKLLRERFARERVGDEGVGSRCFQAHEKTELVQQLEKSMDQTNLWKLKYNSALDEASDLRTDCNEYREKTERLSKELSYILCGDKKRIIDVDALCMENKYLQERVKQCQEEKNALHSQITKYKSILNSKRSTKDDLLNQNTLKSSGLIFSPKQIKDILQNPTRETSSKQAVCDLQSIASALLETINDKNLALYHLRNTNKILGNRVSELEGKIKALEVSGLWNCQGRDIKPNIDPSSYDKDEASSNEFTSNFGSRLSKIMDVTKTQTSAEAKLVSLTPEYASSNSGDGDNSSSTVKNEPEVTQVVKKEDEDTVETTTGVEEADENYEDKLNQLNVQNNNTQSIEVSDE